MAIVKVKDQRRFGIPVVTTIGKVEPSKHDGTFELADHHAEKLIQDDTSFCYHDAIEEEIESLNLQEEIKPKAHVDEFHELDPEEVAELELLQKSQNMQNELAKENEIQPEEQDQKQLYKQTLSMKTKAQLAEVATNAGFAGVEWRALNKEALVDYLVSKLIY